MLDLFCCAGATYVLENVPGARRDLREAVTLTGGMFGLGVHRPRLFETNWLLMPPPAAPPPKHHLGVYGKLDGRRLWTRNDGTELRAPRTLQQAQEAMGMPWVGEFDAITEAIPPAMTEYIGRQLFAVVESGLAGAAVTDGGTT